MKRAFDLVIALVALAILAIPLAVVALLVRLSSRGPVLYWSERVGRHSARFQMPKFRTMRTDTPPMATHLLENPEKWLTPVGRVLRRTSLDELPQLWSIVRGDMSFVGPRPALFNQDDLIALRSAAGVDALMPGLTGWAQINGRDEIAIPEKVRLDAEYLHRGSMAFDLLIIACTALQAFTGSNVSH